VWLIFFQKMYGAWVGLAILALFWVLAFWVTKPSNSR
jgi:tetrahydromethanopterin S-methyltransferase subunit B